MKAAIRVLFLKMYGKVTLLLVLTTGAFGVAVAGSGWSLSHPLSYTSPAGLQRNFIGDTIHLLAVMVEFQKDSDPRTTGDGTFDLTTRADSIIDPPPHDRAYFDAHLQFAANYYRKISDGKINLVWNILDQVVTVPKPMSAYAPAIGSNDLSNLANLPIDVWTKVDSLFRGIDFSAYDLFVIFHAGAGHDVNFYGPPDLDPTPFDLPSVYFSLQSFRYVFGFSYMGIPVRGGSYWITNSIIMPETESREVPTLGGTTLLQLSINGILLGNIGSYLGLPDLFDTRTGASGIGRFGLMDGAAMFSFNGLFPPEPSAWERIQLGIASPIDCAPQLTRYSLPAHFSGREPVILRVPISAREYFLVENRSRDPQGNGVTLTILFNGKIERKHFQRDTVGFNAFDTKQIYGVVIDVDHFDWSLPGGVDESASGEFYDGGILIWHIDENVIRANSATNTVNADPRHRGVNLMEADGSQDIGQSYGDLDPGRGSEYGTPLDFWFEGNPAPVYRNEFSSTSHPNSLSYSDIDAGIVIRDFSSRSPVMSCSVSLGKPSVQPLSGFPVRVGASDRFTTPVAADLTLDGEPEVILNAGGRLLVFGINGKLLCDSTGAVPYQVKFVPAVNDKRTLIAAATDSGVVIAQIVLQTGKLSFNPTFVSFRAPVSTSPMFVGDTVVVGDSLGHVHFALFTGLNWTVSTGLSTIVDLMSWTSLSGRPYWGAVAAQGITWHAIGDSIASVMRLPRSIVSGTGARNFSGRSYPDATIVDGAIVLFNDGSMSELPIDGLISVQEAIDTPPTGPALHPLDVSYGSHIVLADLNGPKVVGSSRGALVAVNSIGAIADGFPFESRLGPISSVPVAGKTTEGKGIVAIGDSSGGVHLIAEDGREFQGFPMQAGDAVIAPMSLAPADSGSFLFAVSMDGYLYGWKTTISVRGSGAQFLASPSHPNWAAFNQVAPIPEITSLLLASRTYNWPNPVYGKLAYLRFFPTSNAHITISIFDLSGYKVQELTAEGVGGIDNEIPWDVSNLASGVYLVKVHAESGSRTGDLTFKAAIVK
ncbi:MAG: T9SS type A sorting domain-containing protein [Bacteroidota bacterium]